MGWAEGPASFYVNVSSAPVVVGRVTAESFLVRIPESTQPIKQTAGFTWIDVEPAKTRVRKLIRLLLETWSNVIKISRVFGISS